MWCRRRCERVGETVMSARPLSVDCTATLVWRGLTFVLVSSRDVAARNCLITSRLAAKLSCPRVCRDAYRQEYCVARGEPLPLRWLPAEAALDDDFSSRSDCWSWAVLCWEVLCQGELPHAALSDDQLTRRLAAEGAPPPLVVPADTPTPLAAAMARCWAASPRDRPDMADVVRTLAVPDASETE